MHSVDPPSQGAAVARMLALRKEGKVLREVAAILNTEGYRGPLGGRWHTTSVHRTLQRILHVRYVGQGSHVSLPLEPLTSLSTER